MNVKPHSENSNFFRIGNHSVASLVNTNDLIAHLRVLSAFHGLKAQVQQNAAHRGLDPNRSWVQYIEHAVERFHNWACRLSDREMSALQSEPLNIDLGILMVWHTYLLNPHTYLRDSLIIYPALTKLGAFPLTRVTADPIVVLESFANATNFQSPSSINMVEAVIRQESFIEKMVQLGWASNPSETLLTRCVTRYHSFLDLIASGTVKAVVPTLDIVRSEVCADVSHTNDGIAGSSMAHPSVARELL
ncbi:hypothetical protein FRC02_007188 [Tulasnella sp. 418]|nr:hypothetical protein FRC02_007188 [Tulasnella sp. 418]